MKKIALAALLASGLMAAGDGVYVGFDLGSTEYKGTDKWTSTWWGSGSESFSDKEASQTLKVGYYLNANNRVNAFLQRIDLDEAKAYSYGIGYDYLIGDNAFKPFIGVLAGRNTLNPDDGGSVSGTIYGAQLGVNYAFNENFSAEAGYRYMASTMKDSWSEGPGETGSFEIDSIRNWFIGVNYKF